MHSNKSYYAFFQKFQTYFPLIFPFLIIFSTTLQAKQPQTYFDILKSLKYPEKLIFDLTPSANQVISGNTGAIEDTSYFLTSQIYYSGGSNESWQWSATPYLPKKKYFGYPTNFTQLSSNFSLHILFNRNSLKTGKLSLKFIESFPSANYSVIFDSSEDNPDLIQAITSLRSKLQTIPVGYTITIQPNNSEYKSTVFFLDFILVHIKLKEIPLSFSQFKNQLYSIVNPILESFRRINLQCFAYIKLSPPPEHNFIQNNRHYYFLLQFSTIWLNSGQEFSIILDSFPTKQATKYYFSKEATLQNIVTPILPNFGSVKQPCFQTILLETASKSFNNILINYKLTLELNQVINNCKFNEHLYKEPFPSVQPFETSIFIPKISWNNISLYFYKSENILNFNNSAKKFTVPQNTSVACFIPKEITFKNQSSFIQAVFQKCSLLQTSANQPISPIFWQIDLNFEENVTKSIKYLTEVAHLRNSLINTFPNSYKPKIILWLPKPRGIYAFGAYCDSSALALNEKLELLINFARLHDFQVIYKELFAKYDATAWFGFLYVSDNLYDKSVEYPVFVARNYPKLQTIGDFPTNPCIDRTLTLPETGISQSSQYSGVTWQIEDLPDAKVNQKILQIQFIFVANKFSLIEINPKTPQDLQTLINFLSDKLFYPKLNNLVKNVSNLKLYLTLNPALIKSELIFNEITTLAVKLTGVHLTNWQNTPNISNLIQNFIKNDIQLGLVLQNCINETLNDFNSLKNFLITPKISYFLCNIKTNPPTSNTNAEETSKFLDTHFYIQQHYHRLFSNDIPKKELIFKLNPSTFTRQSFLDSKNFLKLLSDLNKYASAYKLKYFMISAFDNLQQKQFGWWKITDYQNLANLSTYFDKESEILGKVTWRPNPANFEQSTNLSPSFFSSIQFILGLNLSLIAILSLAVILTIFWYRNNYSILSIQEVKQFRQGIIETATKSGEIPSLKCPQEFKLSEENILLINILGKGNFGVVYNAELLLDENSKKIAVKIPIPGASKDLFKTMLSELKVLIYVGSHPNIIGFVGANIKEIGKGKIYIATELCENGALQTYLRSLKQNSQENRHPSNQCSTLKNNLADNLPQLNQFSYEICLGMEYLSLKKIIHGDLATRNILLDSHFSCKIGDFGLSRKLYEYSLYIKQTQEPLPWRWMAPESLKRMEFTTKSDTWSYGITLWEIFTLGDVPYPGCCWTQSLENKMENGLRPTCPPLAPLIIYNKMKTCWAAHPDDRPTFSELIPFFKLLRSEEYTEITAKN